MQRWNSTTQVAEPCDKIIISFRAQKLPDEVELYFGLYKVKLYTRKPMLCKCCYKYGHNAARCNKQKLCSNCLQHFERLQLKHGEMCTLAPTCNYCNANNNIANINSHQTNCRTCPENIRQKQISNLMAEKKFTFFEAKKIYNERNG